MSTEDKKVKLSTLEKIKIAQKKARVAAMKEKTNEAIIAKGTLTTLLGDLETRIKGGEDIDEAKAVGAIKKTIGVLNDNYELVADDKKEDITIEIGVLEALLPQQLTDEQLAQAVEEAIAKTEASTMKQMGLVMKELNAKHSGLFDGGKASGIVKSKLS